MTRALEYEPADELLMERGRTLARCDAVSHIRRAASALLACRVGEGCEQTLNVTYVAHQRLILVLRELEMLA
jgi:hypothetical protein